MRLNTILLILIIGFSSCKKYLDEKSNKNLVVPGSIDDLQKLLDDNVIMNAQSPGYGEASSDDIFLLESNYDLLGVDNQREYTWQKIDNNYFIDWSGAYNKIYNANFCLEQIEKYTPAVQTQLQWNNVKGSSLFFRAYSFLELAWTFAKAYDASSADSDLGIVLRLGSDFNVPSVRSSVSETYNQILQDTKSAAALLPDNPQNVGRPSKAAAYGLLARTYLSMRIYDSAYKYADLALQIKSDLKNYNDADVSTGSIPFQPFNKEIIFYTTMTTAHLVKSPTYALVDTTLYSSYNANDKRSQVFFGNSGSYKNFKGSYAASATTLFTGLAVDEIYLIRAECNARAGRITEAINDLNTLLIKRWNTGTYINITSGTQQQAIDTILLERRRELLMRAIRWSDIKRLNKEGANIILKRKIGTQIITLLPNDDRYALLLPSDIINITGMPQNPGW